ncbi:hypothetical protein FGADI_5797 [Fusarium gaditjirri]|uniref:Copper-fist domain-containing protein n=1 Tax=Fusarium gaditjirri TaxID=282569 RepID=A0A8H4WXQ4_9HYPO|nr:hypothetical protein FGADI_5797 [Fusarium gaditjirri]
MSSNTEKLACESCIRGHRVAKCQHTDRPLLRDPTQLPVCSHEMQMRIGITSGHAEAVWTRTTKGIQSPLSTDKGSTPSTALSLSESEDRAVETSPAAASSCCDPKSAPSHDTTETIDPISTLNLGTSSAWNPGDGIDPWNPSVLDSLPETFFQGPQDLAETWDLVPDIARYGPAPMAIPTFDNPSTMESFDAGSLFNDIDISQLHLPDEWIVGDLTTSESHDPETQPNPL